MVNPQYQSQQVGDDTNDPPRPVPAQRLDTTTLNQLEDLSAPQAEHQRRVLASVLGMPGGALGVAEGRSSPSSSRRPDSPQEIGLNPPPLAKAIDGWYASKQSAIEAIPRSKTPSPVLSGSGPSGMALSFLKNRVQEKTAMAVSDSLVQGLRRDMRDELLFRLNNRSNVLGSSGASISNLSPELQAAFAQRLEELLFKTSKSVKAYADSTTLDRRLQVLIAAMQKRKAKKDQPASAVSKSAIRDQEQVASKGSRSPMEQKKREALRKILGQDKMNRVFKVVAEIKLIQLGREVTQGKPYEPIPMCTRGGCSFSVPCPGDQKAPLVVRDLFFHTAIVSAYEKGPVERFSSLPWDQLLAQGEARLAAYHEWFRHREAARNTQSFIMP